MVVFESYKGYCFKLNEQQIPWGGLQQLEQGAQGRG